jgi:hypothetical protein
LVEALVERTGLDLGNIDLHSFEISHHGLVLWIIDASEWLEDTHCIVLYLVLLDLMESRVMVLLVVQQDMVEQGALTGQEGTGDVESSDVPVLLLHLLLLLHVGTHEAIAGLNDESLFGGDTEVGYDEQLEFFEEGLAGELGLIAHAGHEVPHAHGLDLHDVADVQVHYPLALV